ncbi:hypothetical protein [Pseudomonas sp.]|uniref:hypothetical protein n=1 Tax=Pseudomonas sp. TaxID=306 RepID=UPI003BB5347F
MTAQDTRTRLVKIIKEHQLEHGLTKLAIGTLAESAGISRQAFNRYYGDLKPYCLGKSVSVLLTEDPSSIHDVLIKREEEILSLKSEIDSLKKQHQKDLAQAIDQHISTLMNNDILALEANEISTLLINQNQHNEMLKLKLTQLELERARSIISSIDNELAPGTTIKRAKNLITLAIDLSNACKRFQNDNDFDSFEDAKDSLINNHLDQLNKLPKPSDAELHIFQERYISPFDNFAAELPAKEGKVIIVIQLPLYAQADLSVFLSRVKRFQRVIIHVPFCTSDAVIAANRKFLFRNIPEYELVDADKAKAPLTTWGFDEIRLFRI